jgi:hypothetical protein
MQSSLKLMKMAKCGVINVIYIAGCLLKPVINVHVACLYKIMQLYSINKYSVNGVAKLWLGACKSKISAES